MVRFGHSECALPVHRPQSRCGESGGARGRPITRRHGRERLILWLWVADYPESNADIAAFAAGGYNARRAGYTWNTAEAALGARADSTSTERARVALYGQIQQTWLREGPWAAVVQPQGIVVLHHGGADCRFAPAFPSNLLAVHKQYRGP